MDINTPVNEEAAMSNGRAAIDKGRIKAEKANIDSEMQDIGAALQQMREAANGVYRALSSIGLASSDLAKQKVEKGRETAMQYELEAENYLRERPLAAVGIAFAVGFVAAKLLQSPRR